jgi:hypothetical protein
MATFGQGINAQLGAIDYSPIQRGSAVGAQLAAQGGQMIGEGLAQGIQQYTKKKEERDMYTSGIESKMGRIVSAMKDFAANPAAYNNVPPVSQEELNTYTTNAQKAIGGSIGAQKSFYAEVASLEDRVQQAPAKALQFIQLRAAQEEQRLRPEVAKYLSERINGTPIDVMDGRMPFTKVSAEAQVAGEQALLQRRLVESNIEENNAQAAARASATGKEQEVRNATVAVGKALERLRGEDGNIVFTGGLTREDLGNLSPEGVVLANKLFTEASTNQAGLNSILASTARAEAFATESLDATLKPVISEIDGIKYLRMPTQGGGYSLNSIGATDEAKIAEHSKATKKVLDDYFAAGATPAAKFVASAALFKLNPFLAQSGGIYLIDDLLEKANPNPVPKPKQKTKGVGLPDIKVNSIQRVGTPNALGGD